MKYFITYNIHFKIPSISYLSTNRTEPVEIKQALIII
ncbi:unnamed protein product [Brugia timori]|uniref:Uncharacterized protein n=1 Tax=Brugia timori TaxID=42155 RepID=A0A0R3QWB1_9BILA|nr:unnamed protein product [Brugia timori]